MPPGIFVGGTDTEVGKTYAAALLAADLHRDGQRVGVYKPAASGCLERDGERVSEDALALWQAAGRPRSLGEVCPQRFLAPLAPNVAARQEGRTVDAGLLRRGVDAWAEADVLIVEGAGGIMSPLSDEYLNLDLAVDLGYPLLLVAANRLGVINHTLLSLEVAQGRGLRVAGVLLNDVQPAGDASRARNLAELRRWAGDIPVHPLRCGDDAFPAELLVRLTRNA